VGAAGLCGAAANDRSYKPPNPIGGTKWRACFGESRAGYGRSVGDGSVKRMPLSSQRSAVIIRDGELQELAKAHVTSLVTRPGLQRIVDVARDAAGAATPEEQAGHPANHSRTGTDD
jgi:hypothetical protein